MRGVEFLQPIEFLERTELLEVEVECHLLAERHGTHPGE